MSDEVSTGGQQDNGKSGRCAECPWIESPEFHLTEKEDYVAVLKHFLAEHPHSETLSDVLDDTFVRVSCRECGESFVSSIQASDTNETFVADSYCNDCEEEHVISGLVVQRVPARKVVDQHQVAEDGDDDE